MAILKVARMGHPVLRQVAKPVDVKKIKDPFFQKFIDDMIETMVEYSGVGLAAPQVHEPIRVAVIEFDDENPRYKKKGKSGLHVFINPVVTVLTDEKEGNWEGCLSVPGMRGYVERPNKVRIDYLDRHGKKESFEAEGFLAIVIQHEFDHLDATLFVDRVETGKLVFDAEFEKYILPSLKDDEEFD